MRFWKELRRRHIVRIAAVYAATAWLVLQLGAIVFPALHAPSWCLPVLIGFVALGFPVALVLAWAFEVTPEGVRRTEAINSGKAANPRNRRRVGQTLNIAIIVILAAAVGILAWRQFGTAPERRAHATTINRAATPRPGSVTNPAEAATAIPAKSIAVLPFENLSPDKNNAYFADGIQDLILSKLAQIGGLTVISRTSTMRYQSHPEDLRVIGRQLGVANLLEGSVQKAGNQVLINVQLIDARTDHHLWAKSYTRTLKNVFGVEGEVAEKVAAALKQKLDPAEQARVAEAPTHNPAAYDAYLRGLSLETNQGSSGPLDLKIAAAYRRAVKLDPSFSAAWARLASIDSQLHFYLTDYTPTRLAQAKAALERAQSLAPDAIATKIAAGDYAYYGNYDYAKALALYHEVLKLSPSNAQVLANIGYVNRREGHWQRAIDYLQRSLALDPRNVNTLSSLAWSNACLHRYAKATELLRAALAISNGDSSLTGFLAWIYQTEGRLRESGKLLAGVKISPADWNAYQSLVDQALWTRRYPNAIRLLREALASGKQLSATTRGSYYQLLGFSEQLAGNHDEAHRAYMKAIMVLRSAPAKSPLVLVERALVQASLGRKASALASIRQSKTSTPGRYDAFERPILDVFLAEVQTQLDERSQAIATLRRVLAMPLGSNASLLLTPSSLRLNPVWDPLRKEPAFQALLKQYPAASASVTSPARASP
ncbi:MAG TPA: tetratricopeptide repeat protein [Gammaproteobacteria bacterium]|nr:tetratricopeptide repeat protein [Gammaproteobacteria bacterium]